jgi:hypothetical protein
MVVARCGRVVHRREGGFFFRKACTSTLSLTPELELGKVAGADLQLQVLELDGRRSSIIPDHDGPPCPLASKQQAGNV